MPFERVTGVPRSGVALLGAAVAKRRLSGPKGVAAGRRLSPWCPRGTDGISHHNAAVPGEPRMLPPPALVRAARPSSPARGSVAPDVAEVERLAEFVARLELPRAPRLAMHLVPGTWTSDDRGANEGRSLTAASRRHGAPRRRTGTVATEEQQQSPGPIRETLASRREQKRPRQELDARRRPVASGSANAAESAPLACDTRRLRCAKHGQRRPAALVRRVSRGIRGVR